MVARNRIRTTIVSVPATEDCRVGHRRAAVDGGALARDVLPWADPNVAQLIRKLQDEVRFERRLQSVMRRRALVSVRSLPEQERAHLRGQIE